LQWLALRTPSTLHLKSWDFQETNSLRNNAPWHLQFYLARTSSWKNMKITKMMTPGSSDNLSKLGAPLTL
jgi:hypothetical protein